MRAATRSQVRPRRLAVVASRIRARPGMVLAGIICAGYVLMRLATLSRFPPYSDEVEYAGLALGAHFDPSLRFNSLRDFKGPMLTWLSLPILSIDHSAPLTVVRIVAAFAGLVTVVMTGMIGRRLFGRTAGLIAMAVVAFLPYTVAEGAMGIHEPLVTAAATCVLYLLLRLAGEPRLDLALLLGIALGFGLLTKESGKFALVLLPLGLVRFDWSPPARARLLARLGGYLLLALGVAWVGYSLQKLGAAYYGREHLKAMLNQNYTIDYALGHLGLVLEQNWPSYRVALRDYITIPLIWLSSLGAAWLARTRWREAFVLIPWAALPIAASTVIANKPLGRYYLPSLPAIALLIAFGATAALATMRTRVAGPTLRRWLLAGGLTLAALPALVYDARILATPQTTELPAFSDRELIVDYPSGSDFEKIEAEIRRYGGSAPILAHPLLGNPLALAFGRPSTHPVIGIKHPDAPTAQFVVEIGASIPLCRHPGEIGCAQIDASRFRLKKVVKRPRNGQDIRLYVRDDAS